MTAGAAAGATGGRGRRGLAAGRGLLPAAAARRRGLRLLRTPPRCCVQGTPYSMRTARSSLPLARRKPRALPRVRRATRPLAPPLLGRERAPPPHRGATASTATAATSGKTPRGLRAASLLALAASLTTTALRSAAARPRSRPPRGVLLRRSAWAGAPRATAPCISCAGASHPARVVGPARAISRCRCTVIVSDGSRCFASTSLASCGKRRVSAHRSVPVSTLEPPDDTHLE